MAESVFPIVNELNAPFWAACAEGRLVLPVCRVTGRAFWPPSPLSPFATGGGVDWREAAPTGVLRALVRYRRAFQRAFEHLMPYGVGLVELDAGPRLQAHVRDPDAPGASRAGDNVVLRFEPLVEGGPAVPILGRSARPPRIPFPMPSFGVI